MSGAPNKFTTETSLTFEKESAKTAHLSALNCKRSKLHCSFRKTGGGAGLNATIVDDHYLTTFTVQIKSRHACTCRGKLSLNRNNTLGRFEHALL